MKKIIFPKNEFLYFISFKKKSIKRNKKKILYKNNFRTFWYLKIFLILIIILLLVFIYLKRKKNSYNKKEYKINVIEYKNNFLNNELHKKRLNIINSDINLSQILLKEVSKLYEKNGFVNINEVESTIPNGRAWIKGQKKSKIINVGSALNTKYVLLAMFTIASIIDSQNLETKLRLHFAVVEGFSVENMIKIYTLRDRIRDDVEFNFYNAKKVEIDLNNTNTKGSSVNAKLIIPELLLDDVERVIILDLGDTLILRDLSEMYNWNMEDKIYYGVLDEGVMKYGRFSKKALDIYINTGCYLVDIKKAKSEKIYEKIVKNKSLYKPSPIIDQDLLNDVAYGKIGYLPIRFGLKAPFTDDKISDSPPYRTDYNNILEKAKYKEKYNLPKNRFEMNSQALNPVVIHQWNGKWICGRGLSIYRRIVQNYIRIAGIWDEICPVFPGVCKK